MTKHDITHAQAREKVRLGLKRGRIWSRLNPDLLKGDELLPCMTVDNPPPSGAELVPFPVATRRFANFQLDDQELSAHLAEEKIRWCYPGRKVGTAIRQRVIKGMQYYEVQHPTQGSEYHWIGLDAQVSPYRPLLQTVLPALDNFAQAAPAPPKPPSDHPGEAWFTPEDDAYGVKLYISASLEEGGKLLLAMALHRQGYFWQGNYKLDPNRYSFIRQQIFYLVGTRVKPWTGQVSGKGYRGMVYRKPKQSKKRPG